ncbi:MAG: 50S ribosomal protein L9 [Rickettsiales bacterium TMED254]|nr:50S ribosomal protein L9 [Rickettsiales bacterium]RPF77044.1 MAG: 50S ribosomal protein L9 [Rickettsiales bacterium TMED254]|tara:strand:- start:116 stop:577 length:462 start_codon:yes stop_codon:yes gene_type:complete
MEVILLEKISKLGNIGETVKVRDGYARNYLIPKKVAIRATEANKKVFEEKKDELEKANLKKIEEAKKVLELLPKSIILFREASEQGALFGSVTSRDIVKEINELKKISLNAKDIILKSNIKNLGNYKVEVILHAEVTSIIEVNVKNIEESESQ